MLDWIREHLICVLYVDTHGDNGGIILSHLIYVMVINLRLPVTLG